MIRNILAIIFPMFFMACSSTIAQNTNGFVESEAFEKEINRLLSGTVSFYNVDQLKMMLDDVQVLDAREKEEYDISHIPTAKYIGYKDFEIEELEGVDKDKPLVVYCSIGYRSEKIGEKLEKAGYTNVYNLYGSIFEWANKGYPMEDASGKKTKTLHAYNKKWSKWVVNPEVTKTW